MTACLQRILPGSIHQYGTYAADSVPHATMQQKNSKPRRHRGDIMSPQTRSAVMSRIRGSGTGPEKAMASAFSELGLKWEEHVRELPGRPDFIFREPRVAVFVDGDFWHGWNFKEWRDKLSEKWEAKIAATRRRDARNHRLLREMGWKVIRVWEHQVKQSPARCARRVAKAVQEQLRNISDNNTSS